MSVKSLGTYEFPSRSRQELYGDDILVNVWWKDNPMFCSAAMFRAPQQMTWGDFKSQMVDAWAGSDPDYDPSGAFSWSLEGAPIQPDEGATLTDLGVGHKYTLAMEHAG
ncbi:MAG: phenol hydroxylase subunit P4 [Mobilicoccus sp.]|nr:phenol hydroxylase subunit P4 [Mobilicoccus sp.]